MKRNCNLELGLVTPSVYFHSSDFGARYHHSMLDMETKSQNKKQQLTIFYNGMVASCDATEIQARAIISLASREIEEKMRDGSSSPVVINSAAAADYSPATGLSMKRSLQRFLEKRKTRTRSISPYPNTRH